MLTGTNFSPSLREKWTIQTESSRDIPKSLWETHGLSPFLFIFHVFPGKCCQWAQEAGTARLGLLVHGPQLRFLGSGPPQGTMEGEMTFVIKEYFSLPLTFNCPQSLFLGLECYSTHQLFVVLNACPFPALPSYCNILLPRLCKVSSKVL